MSTTTRVILLPDASIDLRTAAERAGVEFRDVVAAVARKQLPTAPSDPGRPGVWLIKTAELDRWIRGRRGPRERRRLVPWLSAGQPAGTWGLASRRLDR
jgi:hypothetical protein